MIRFKRFATLLSMSLLFISAPVAVGQSSSFTYQGRLQDGSTNANGNYDFQFTLWDSLTGGTQQPQLSPVTVTKSNVAVANGVFSVQLDFGAGAFPGADRFLETSVKLSGTGTFTVLSPRQPITPTPYAIRSASAASADSVPVGSIPSGSGNYIQNTAAQQANSNFNISGNGTVGGTLSANALNASTQLNLGGNRVLSIPGTNNLFAGKGAGTANTTGSSNSFFGIGAGAANQTGSANSFFGSSTGSSMTTGSNNSLFGQGAGANSTTANANSFFGYNAGLANTTGGDNSFFGNGAGMATNTGTMNSFFGESAGGNNTSGLDNTFVGAGAGSSNTSGMKNSFFGYLTGISHTTGNGNTLVGFESGGTNVAGNNNTALGLLATFGASTLSNATAIGANAQVNQSNALVLGSISGINSATADTNVGIGTTTPTARLDVSGNTNITGNLTVSGTLNATLPAGSANYIQNTSSQQANSNFNITGNGTIGGTLSGNSVNAATQFNIGGNRVLSVAGSTNIFAGVGAGQANTTGSVNAFFGFDAGRNNVNGSNNSFFGEAAGQANLSGSENSFFGNLAGSANNSGSSNVFMGDSAGESNSSGSDNVFVGGFYFGSAGGTNTTGTLNTVLGAGADVGSGNLTNATAIGANAQVNQSNSIVLGSISGLNAANANTNVGIGTVSPAVPLEVRRDGAVASDWQQGQLRISGQANPARQLSLGYDTSSNLGVIQAGEGGVAFRDLSLNPSGGNVAIGTISPSFKLHVNGETRTNTLSIDAYVANNGGPSLCANTSNNRIALCTSSLRYKTNVQSFRNGLGIISRLRPISFDWKDGGTHDVGLAAEEVARVEPLLTFRNNKGEIEGVKYNQLSAVFINAFKEQQAQILEQQDEIKKERAQLRQQESVLTRQQGELDALKKLVCSSHRRASACR